MKRNCTLFLFLFLVFTAASLTSCKEFEGDQTVPAFIRIDTVGLACDYYTYGANTHRFIDACLYIDEDPKGTFELPATIPVLEQGPHNIKVYGGIALNGIKNARVEYPFTAPAVFNNVDLVPDSIVTLTPVVTYWPLGENIHVSWMEDFDKGTISMETTSQSDVPMIRTSGPMAWHDPEGVHSTYSANFVLNSDTTQFFFANSEEITDINNVYQCILEMDYKCSDTCCVGLYYMLNYSLISEPLVRLRPTCASGEDPVEWRKIYINLTPYVQEYKDADYFKIYLSSWNNRNNGEQSFYFDNLKIIYYDR